MNGLGPSIIPIEEADIRRDWYQVSFKRKSSRLSTGVAMCEKLDRCSHEVIVAKGGKVTHCCILGLGWPYND